MPLFRKLTIIEKIHKVRRFIGRTTTNILFVVNVFFFILLLVSFMAWYVEPSISLIPTYLGLGFIILFSINVAFLILWIIFLKWKRALFCIISLIISWGGITVYFPIHTKTEVLPDDCIKIMTYNVMGFNWDRDEKARDKPIFEYIANSNADIICMQEVVINNIPYDTTGVISITEIDNILSDYPYRSIVRFGKAEGIYSFGVACYSKFPIRKTEEIEIDSEFNGVAIYNLDIKGRKVNLINVHLESNRITQDDKQLYKDFLGSGDFNMLDTVSQNIHKRLGSAYLKRAKEAESIAQVIDSIGNQPIILCGDFNDTPISYVYKTVRGDKLKDSFADTGSGQGISYHKDMFWFRIDYIMHSKNIKAYNTGVEKVTFSDHYPLISYLKFEETTE